eukprot:363205-Chlamydomonas_euryale.AAC.6
MQACDQTAIVHLQGCRQEHESLRPDSHHAFAGVSTGTASLRPDDLGPGTVCQALTSAVRPAVPWRMTNTSPSNAPSGLVVLV